MALLIDGYNLLHVTEIFSPSGLGTELHRARGALLKFLAQSIGERERKETTIVFDAAGAQPGLTSTMDYDGITVRFARRHSDADELIEDLLEQCPAPKSLVVVSSDHRVQRAARHRGATFIDSDRWFADLQAARRMNNVEADSPGKPDGEMTPADLAYWVNEFDVPEAKDHSANPFPPGYAEDIEEDE